MSALSRQEVAALREGDVVLVRMVVRRPLGEHGTVHAGSTMRRHGGRTTCRCFRSISLEEMRATLRPRKSPAERVNVRLTLKAP
jgi:hypothetical protein